MKPSNMSDRQRKMILDRQVTDGVLAERLGTSVREIKRQRAKLLEKVETS